MAGYYRERGGDHGGVGVEVCGVGLGGVGRGFYGVGGVCRAQGCGRSDALGGALKDGADRGSEGAGLGGGTRTGGEERGGGRRKEVLMGVGLIELGLMSCWRATRILGNPARGEFRPHPGRTQGVREGRKTGKERDRRY